MLLDKLKDRIKQAMRDKNALEKDLLRVVVGDLETEIARRGELSDAEAEKVLRKMVKSNRETYQALQGHANKADELAKLDQELALLESFLPKTLSADEVEAALAEVLGNIRDAAQDGVATGLAMKHLKGAGAVVDGKVVSEVVKKLRAG